MRYLAIALLALVAIGCAPGVIPTPGQLASELTRTAVNEARSIAHQEVRGAVRGALRGGLQSQDANVRRTAEIAQQFVEALEGFDLNTLIELSGNPLIFAQALRLPLHEAAARLSEAEFAVVGVGNANFELSYRLGNEVGDVALRVNLGERRITNATRFLSQYLAFLEGR